MLFVRASHINPRLQYSLEIIFSYVLKVPFQLVSEVADSTVPLLEYVTQKHENSYFIPACGLLEEEGMERRETKDLMTEKGEDVLAKVFWYITEYEKQSDPLYDQYGRYDEKAYIGFQKGWHREPMIHVWCEKLWKELQAKFPSLERGKHHYQGMITYDLDHPWKYLNKGVGISLGGMAKRMINGKWAELGEQLRAIFTQKDPYFTFSEMLKLSSPEKTRLFCLIDRHSTQDSRFTYRNKRLRKLIQQLVQQKYTVGIHPSYTTFQDKERIQFEVKKLAEIVGKPIIHSRLHFLRYRLPETFRYLIEAGIQHDYTLGLYSEMGFRTGMAIPYPWFDLGKNEITALMLHPTLAMDRTLQAYMKLSPAEALIEVKILVEKVKEVNGTFTLLLHNDSLSESGEWKGWRDAVKQMIGVVLNDD